jgi:DNA-binding response OmpR family regulator
MAKIVIIEDDEMSAEHLAHILISNGHEVLHEDNGTNGIQLVKNEVPDVVLLDINLPDVDGKVVARRLRGLPNGQYLPIIAVTGLSSETFRQLAIAYGCDDVITKPIDRDTLLQTIEHYLG